MSSVPEALEERNFADSLRLFLDITRPKVMALVVFTGLPALALGTEWPSLQRIFWVLLGTALAGGACSALNAWYERDLDIHMARTRNRPLPAAAMVPHVVLVYGIVLSVVSTALLWVVGGPVAALVSVATIIFYFGIYTVWLKRRTPQNIVIGGAAGGTAPLIASAAVDGHIGVGAWILFLLIFLWTPSHFWAVALYRKDEYRTAGVPMMPLVVGDQPTRWRSLGYTLAMLVCAAAPVYLGYLGVFYAAVSTALGAWYTWLVIVSLRTRSYSDDRKVFRGSIIYLTLVFLAMLVDLAL